VPKPRDGRRPEGRYGCCLFGTEMRLTFAFVCLATTVAGCGGRSLTSPTITDALAARVPQKHRPAGTACPAPRGPGSGLPSNCTADAGGPRAGILPLPQECQADTDCVAGTNGRCQPFGGPIASCGTNCSYDACSADSDCPAGQPCECRGSAADSSANVCLTGGNCRVDGDCGPGGFCSPSQIESFCFCPSPALCPEGGVTCTAGNTQVACACGDSCGHSTFCHTPNDECLDDADCAGNGTCNYDTVNRRWDCATCWPIP
jgi:hypothetical protein